MQTQIIGKCKIPKSWGLYLSPFSDKENHLEVAEKAHNSHRQNITYTYLFIILHNVYFTEM